MSGVVIWVSQKEGRHPKFTQVGGGGIGIRSQLFITPKPEAPSWAFETTTAVALKCEVRESRWGSLCEPPSHLSAPLPAKTPTQAPRKPPRLWAQQAWAALSGLRPALGQGGEAPRCQSWEATRCEKSPWQPRITILGSGGHPAAPPSTQRGEWARRWRPCPSCGPMPQAGTAASWDPQPLTMVFQRFTASAMGSSSGHCS